MFKAQAAFGGLSVDNLDTAKLDDETMGLQFKLPNGGGLFIYLKDNHQPALFTVLNFVVDDIDTAVDELAKLGVTFERYDNMPGTQDEKGILRGRSVQQGPDIAWFKDPAGNILSVLQD